MKSTMVTYTWNQHTKNIFCDMPTSKYTCLIFLKLKTNTLVSPAHLSLLPVFRVLLRVRMLYYIKHEVLAEVLDQITDNVPVR